MSSNKRKTRAHPMTDREAMKLVEREGKHPVRSAKQAIAIGLSKAKKHGIPLKRAQKNKKAA